MYRHRYTIQVRYGHFAQYLENAEQLNKLARTRGRAESTFWIPVVGRANEFLVDTDYPDLATFQREGDAFQADAEGMKLLRNGVVHVVEGSGHNELLVSATEPS